MRKALVDLVLLLLASPVLALRALVRAHRQWHFLRLATATEILCECGSAVSLVGLWRCSCGFTYRGHLLRRCPVCYTIPSVVRCYRCGVTIKLPEAS